MYQCRKLNLKAGMRFIEVIFSQQKTDRWLILIISGQNYFSNDNQK
jgi:hypothetical protein